MRFVSYDSFVLLCWNHRDNLRTTEFRKACVQLFALPERVTSLIFINLKSVCKIDFLSNYLSGIVSLHRNVDSSH